MYPLSRPYIPVAVDWVSNNGKWSRIVNLMRVFIRHDDETRPHFRVAWMTELILMKSWVELTVKYGNAIWKANSNHRQKNWKEIPCSLLAHAIMHNNSICWRLGVFWLTSNTARGKCMIVRRLMFLLAVYWETTMYLKPSDKEEKRPPTNHGDKIIRLKNSNQQSRSEI